MDKKKKMLLVVAAAAVIAAAIYRFFPAVGAFGPSDESLLLKEKELHKLRGIVHERPGLESRLAALQRQLTKAEGGLLSGDTPALAAVDIQNILTGIAGEIDVDVKAMRVLRTEKENKSKYIGIPVQINVMCSIDQLKDLLYRIETSRRYLRVTSLRINVRRRRKGREKGSIFSSLTVEGIMKKGMGKNALKNQEARTEQG